jgi:hypothetical protein
MLEKLAGKSHYCFLDGFSGYFQIFIAPEDQDKQLLHARLVHLHIGESHLDFVMPQVHFSGAW